MSAVLRKILGLRRRKVTKKDSITGRNNSFPVPYLAKLEGNQLQPGQSLIVRGIVIGKQDFVINLTNGPRVEFDDEVDVLDDRLLCLRVDIERKKIHINACVDGEWGREGAVRHKWQCGDEFDIRVRCHDEEYEIYVDHKLVARFAHYVPLSKITHIYINGDIELFSSSWEGMYYTVPYSADIPGHFYPGRKLYVSALAKKKAKEFFIVFQSGADIALHKIICNSRINDKWGTEDTLCLEPFMFKRKRNFDLLVYCEEAKFLVYVDDCLIGTFEHRINPRSVDKIQISGDIVLQGVHLK